MYTAGIPARRQRLMLDGEEVDDSRCLREHGGPGGTRTTLQLLLREEPAVWALPEAAKAQLAGACQGVAGALTLGALLATATGGVLAMFQVSVIVNTSF